MVTLMDPGAPFEPRVRDTDAVEPGRPINRSVESGDLNVSTTVSAAMTTSDTGSKPSALVNVMDV
jgi:hypothetical protein